MKFLLLPLAFLASLTFCSAQDYSDQVYQQLHRRYEILKSSGKSLKLEKTIINNVEDDVSDDWTFYFDSDNSYAVIGACDNDCSDIDLKIVDADSGNVMVEDTDSDDTPVVSFSPKSSGRYKVKMKMYDCNTSYCYSGFSIYSF